MTDLNSHFGSYFIRVACFSFAICLLTACGGGGGTSPESNTYQVTEQSVVTANPSALTEQEPDPTPLPTPIEITPQQIESANVIIDWQPPTSRVDGSEISMSEIDFYVIYIENKSKTFNQIMQIDGTSSEASWNDVKPDDYIVFISVIDSLNNWSKWSNTYEIKKSSFSS